jgi:ergothioneine biosynthesis protein EgtB
MPRGRLRDEYVSVRGATAALAAPLTPEDHMVQSMPDASPAKWHLAHTTWFFETFVLAAYRPGYQPGNPAFAHLFNSYYEAVGPRVARAERGLVSRPALSEVHAYRHQIDEAVLSLLDALPPEGEALVTLGLNHEQQHQELLLTDIKHAFSRNVLRPAYRPAPAPAPGPPPPPLQFVPHAEGLAEIGHQGAAFAFDNEGPRHRVFLRGFALASRLVTCGEYLAFMEDGGYRQPALWLSEGWDLVRTQGWTAPLYWEQTDGWMQHTLTGTRPIDPAEPVCHVSHYEADAFARWAGARLPTEGEWERAAAPRPVAGNFVESGRLHPVAAGSDDLQLFGDVWEWTGSPYTPYPGYRAAAGALGEYNGKFMSNQMVLRGGSCLSPHSHLRASYRNFFSPTARWQMSGLRLAKDV